MGEDIYKGDEEGGVRSSFMRQIIQFICLAIVFFLGLVLSGIDRLPLPGFSKTIATYLTIFYIIVFLAIAVDPNVIRKFVFGPFGPYVNLLIAIIVLLLTYLFLLPVISTYFGG